MDLQTIGNIVALQRKEIRKLKARLSFRNLQVKQLKEEIKVLIDKVKTDAAGKDFIEGIVCSPGQHEYFTGKHPMTDDSIHKPDDEVFGPKKKRSYE